MAKTTTFPTLYKQTEGGAIQTWDIEVQDATIVTRFGQQGGAIQTATDLVTEGKNAGKKNATTAEEQAVKEAKSKWEKQQKAKGYVQSLAKAEDGGREAEFVQGGIDPMLAHKWRDHSAKMPFPALAQPKFDGIRCIAVIANGKATLWTRTRKPITGVPHIIIHLERAFAGRNAILDGELYNHAFKNEFEKIVSFVRQVKAKPGHEVVQYHIYDTFQPGKSNQERNEWLRANIPANHGTLKRVETISVSNREEIDEYMALCIENGYEGCMIRNPQGTYQNKRSYNLLKVKEFDDAEFVIVGTEEGRGKMAGKAIFNCKTDKGDVFAVKMKGSLDSLSQYLNNPAVVGKKLTVRFQGWTNGNVPRFPVGISVRDYE